MKGSIWESAWRMGCWVAAPLLVTLSCTADPAASGTSPDSGASDSAGGGFGLPEEDGAAHADDVPCSRDGDCDADHHCARGACAPDVCQPGAATCAAGDEPAVTLCTAAGDRELRVLCSSGESCTRDAGTARCANWVCTPDGARCTDDGLTVLRCSTDGLAEEVAADCGAAGGRCVAGECRDQICTPLAASCEGQDLYLCSADGTAQSRTTTCASGSYCNAEAATCSPQICTPLARACVDGAPTQCSENGSAWISGTPCLEDEVCAAGECRAVVCRSARSFCGMDLNVRTCLADGTGDTVAQDCTSAASHCEDNGTQATCVVNACIPGQPHCSGNLLVTCSQAGTVPAEGTDCTSAGGVCSGGECRPRVCDPAAPYVCVDGNVHYCLDNGSTTRLSQACDPATRYCNPAAGGCSLRICATGAPGCTGSVHGVCNAEGSGFSGSAVDCSATRELCTPGGCESSVVEELGTTSGGGTGGEDVLFANLLDVSGSRRLLQLAIGMSIGEPVTLTWLVYELSGSELRLVSSTVTQQAAFIGMAMVSSSPLDLPLEAGRTYALGVRVTGMTDATTTVYTSCSGASATSFGVARGYVYSHLPAVPDAFPLPAISRGCFIHQALTVGAP